MLAPTRTRHKTTTRQSPGPRRRFLKKIVRGFVTPRTATEHLVERLERGQQDQDEHKAHCLVTFDDGPMSRSLKRKGMPMPSTLVTKIVSTARNIAPNIRA